MQGIELSARKTRMSQADGTCFLWFAENGQGIQMEQLEVTQVAVASLWKSVPCRWKV